MTDPGRILAIDQGTTSTRALLFDEAGRPTGVAQRELPQHFPSPGRVEHDPRRIWADTVSVCREVLERCDLDAAAIAAIGITNQRETTLLWERDTGRPLHPAIVWQDRRTAGMCRELRDAGHEPMVREKTGLLLDPYFSGTKLAWLLENVDGARSAADRGELAFGTVDSWLLWNLTGGRVHATDSTNASRTLLFDIHQQEWDPELLELFGIPRALLPDVRDSSSRFGDTEPEVLGSPIPVTGVAGDQQAATFGQAALTPGQAKLTCGTGAFLLLNTGTAAIQSDHGLLTTVAWRLDGKATYALEGSIFSAGSAVQWLRDELGLVDEAGQTEELARRAGERSGVYLVPAFTGLGAPHWDPQARGGLMGLTRDAGRAEIARAALESVGYQTLDLVEAMVEGGAVRPETLRVDGGFSRNDWAMGFLSDVLDLPVERPAVTETTARGAAHLAGLEVGVGGLDEIAQRWSPERTWAPTMAEETRRALVEGWRQAVSRVLTSEAGRG